MKKKMFTGLLATIIAVGLHAQSNFPNGFTALKGNSFAGSALLRGSQIDCHFQYSDAEDTYIRGGKPTSRVIIGDIGASGLQIGNAAATTLFPGNLTAQNGLTANKGTSFGGSALFNGSEFPTHFHYSDAEDTYIRGGKSSSKVIIGDVNVAVIVGQGVTTPAGYRLYVDQGILTEKVKVAVKTSADWADYVFDEKYRLMPLGLVAQFIQQNKHLPGMPSANEMVKEGNDLGKTDALLLQKIEELTLHLIELNRKLEAQQKQIETLKAASPVQ
jgi:hypothetical protein